MSVLRLTHVNVVVEDVVAAQAFYGGVLELAELPRAEGARRPGAWYRIGAAELHVSEEPGARDASASRHFALAVSNLAHLRAALKRAGAPLEPGRPLPGMERLFTRDPSGNRLELQELTSP